MAAAVRASPASKAASTLSCILVDLHIEMTPSCFLVVVLSEAKLLNNLVNILLDFLVLVNRFFIVGPPF